MSARKPTAAPELHLGKDDRGRTVSAEEFADAIYEEPWKYERVHGRLVVATPDGAGHVAGSNPWLERLFVYKSQNPSVVELVVPGAWVRVDGGTDRIGEIGIYLVVDPRAPEIPDRVPDLMFEIFSRGSVNRMRDYVEKRADYHKLGIPEYVIIDNFQKRVTVLEHEPEGYRERVLTVADTYETPRLPGLAVPLAEVLGA
jgi:Uma2 family endonuclease